MSYHHHLLLLFLLYAHLTTTTTALKLEPTNIPKCPSVDCGNGVKISYPFWVSNSTSIGNYCGYQGLEVTCKDKTPSFRAFSDNYTITDINTGKRTVSLTDTDVLDKPCPRVKHQVDLTNTPNLGYASGVTNLTFFFDCSTSSLVPRPNLAPCLAPLPGDSYVFIGIVSPDIYKTLSKECKGGVVVSPILEDKVDRGKVASMFPKALKEGFELTWKEPEMADCRDCEGNGGYCGLQNKTGNGTEFVCFCPNGSINPRDCNVRAAGKKPNAWKKIIIVTSLTVGVMIFLSFTCIIWKNKRKTRDIDSVQRLGIHNPSYKKKKSVDLDSLVRTEFYLMDIKTAKAVTNHFSDTNKLGQGGFGSVYKGVLADGNEIAIKRLSSNSTQGAEEFKNEVKLISQLQHKNLVKLLGCCVEGGEKLIIYQYLPNGSLDTVLVDPNKRSELDWETRKHIVFGITRGLTYLHEDSQLKVVHRDLKPSNILLDLSMNAKISDFGLARIFDNDTNEVNTNRLVGTFGYMAPEFAMAGLFSVKSDVFGFGVLLLEIISGQRNGRLHFEQYEQSLLTRAWNLWKEKEGADLVNELVDPSILGKFPTSEAIRWIQIALLCVQENASDRPTMSTVLRMFETEQMELMEPQQPPYFTCHGELPPLICFPDMPVCTSTNMVTMTEVEVR